MAAPSPPATSEPDAGEALARLRFHIQNSPLGLIEFDAGLRITAWSGASERMFGWRAAEVVGRRLEELALVHADDWPRVQQMMADLISGRAPRSCLRNRNVRRDGSIVWCEWYSSALFDASGRLVSFLSQALDVTGRRHAEQALRASERRFRGAIENFPSPFVIYDADERIEFANTRAVAMSGLSEDQLVGYRAEELVPAGGVTPYLPAFRQALATGRRQTVEFTRSIEAGGETLIVTYVPLHDESGKVDQVLGFSIDISERKRAEEALREADRRKDEFLAALAHELRNPLSPIRNGVELLKRVEPAPPGVARVREVMDRQLRHLTRLVDDLLDVSRISRGKIQLRFEPVDLAAIARAAVEDQRSVFAAARIALDLREGGGPVWVRGDPVRLAQVLGNLMQNAAKFTDAGGRVTVGVESDAYTGRARLSVEDTGIGIDPDTLRRVFEPFVQGDQSLARSRGGLGLGLALVRSLVELHGGEVRADSEGPGHGSRFTVQLPLGLAPVQPEPEPAREESGPQRRRILLIEDNPDAAESLCELLELDGHVVTVAHDGIDGLARARRAPPDVVLCDIGLPGELDGYGVAKAFRADPRLRAAHLVALTGYAGPEDRRRTAEAGFDLHFSKPPDFDALGKALSSLPPAVP